MDGDELWGRGMGLKEEKLERLEKRYIRCVGGRKEDARV